MNLCEIGKLLCDLRKDKKMTQKQVADKLGILPKTVSKWETGHGFPDVSFVSALADILGVSERTILSGDLKRNNKDVGNIKRIKFYVCPRCGSIMQGVGGCQVICCGEPLVPLKSKPTDECHMLNVSEIENDYYIEFNHGMTKGHYISFAAFVGFDKVITIKLYPQQDAVVRFPKVCRGTLYFYCTNHGLFACEI